MPHLVFVPGLLCTRDLWAHQLAHLGEIADCQVVDVTGADTIDGLADAVLQQAPAKFSLCGLSMGGIISHAIMRRAPQRVERLALLDTSALADTPEQSERRRALLALADSGRFEAVTETLLPALVHPDRLADESLTAAVKAMADAVGPDAFGRQVRAIMGRIDARSWLPGYACPTLLICGRQDAITPLELHEEMANSIPGAHLAVIEQCGHLATMERPQAVTALLSQWLLYS